MKREILFRGQTRRFGEKVGMNGEKLPGNWVYGGIFPGTGDFSVIYGWETGVEHTGSNLGKFSVYSDTVGRYIGLTDRNGVKIFEGDILKVEDYRGQSIIKVSWERNGLCFCGDDSYFLSDFFQILAEVEVIGNIYDNPWLLKSLDSAEQEVS